MHVPGQRVGLRDEEGQSPATCSARPSFFCNPFRQLALAATLIAGIGISTFAQQPEPLAPTTPPQVAPTVSPKPEAAPTKTAEKGQKVYTNDDFTGGGDASPPQQSNKAQAPPASTRPSAPVVPPKTEAVPTKPPEKARKVYTNDDFADGGGSYFRAVHEILDEVNDCDRNCFAEVANTLKEPNGGSVDFKRQLLRDVESTRSDRDWQALLLDAVHIKERYCQLAYDKNAELAKLPERNKVTDRELNIEEKYNQKYKDAADDVSEIYRREGVFLIHNDRITRGLMQYQIVRIMTANCTPPRAVPADDPPNDPDPDDP